MDSYKTYVELQCDRNPCLLNLKEFLSSPNASERQCRITTLEFYSGQPLPFQRRVGMDRLRTILIPDEEPGHLFGDRAQETPILPPNGSPDPSTPKISAGLQSEASELNSCVNRTGEILIIEDLNPHIIETLGSAFEIDPLFFANHIHSPNRQATSLTPDLATLPSRTRIDTYMNTLYHRGVVFKNSPNLHRQLRQVMNVGRRVAVMPLENDNFIGLVQHSASVFKATFPNNYWIGRSK